MEALTLGPKSTPSKIKTSNRAKRKSDKKKSPLGKGGKCSSISRASLSNSSSSDSYGVKLSQDHVIPSTSQNDKDEFHSDPREDDSFKPNYPSLLSNETKGLGSMAPHSDSSMHVPDETMFMVQALLDLKEGPMDSSQHLERKQQNFQPNAVSNSMDYNHVSPLEPAVSKPTLYSYVDGEIEKVEHTNGNELITLNKGFIDEGEELLSSGSSRDNFVQNGPTDITLQSTGNDTMTIDEALINIERNMMNNYDQVEEREINFEDEYCNSEFIQESVISEADVAPLPSSQSPYIRGGSESFRDTNLNACSNIVPEDICVSSIEEVPPIAVQNTPTITPEMKVIPNFTSLGDSSRSGSRNVPSYAPMLVVNKKNVASKKYYYQKSQPMSRYGNPNEQKWSFLTIFPESDPESSDETLSDIEEHSEIPIRRKIVKQSAVKQSPSSPFSDSSSSSTSGTDEEIKTNINKMRPSTGINRIKSIKTIHVRRPTIPPTFNPLTTGSATIIKRQQSVPILKSFEIIPDYEQEIEIDAAGTMENKAPKEDSVSIPLQSVPQASKIISIKDIRSRVKTSSADGLKKTCSADNVNEMYAKYTPLTNDGGIAVRKRKRKNSVSGSLPEIHIKTLKTNPQGTDNVITKVPSMERNVSSSSSSITCQPAGSIVDSNPVKSFKKNIKIIRKTLSPTKLAKVPNPELKLIKERAPLISRSLSSSTQTFCIGKLVTPPIKNNKITLNIKSNVKIIPTAKPNNASLIQNLKSCDENPQNIKSNEEKNSQNIKIIKSNVKIIPNAKISNESLAHNLKSSETSSQDIKSNEEKNSQNIKIINYSLTQNLNSSETISQNIKSNKEKNTQNTKTSKNISPIIQNPEKIPSNIRNSDENLVLNATDSSDTALSKIPSLEPPKNFYQEIDSSANIEQNLSNCKIDTTIIEAAPIKETPTKEKMLPVHSEWSEDQSGFKDSSFNRNDPFSIKKRLISEMGLTISDYGLFFEDCKTTKEKHEKLISFMRRNGLKGRPSMENCVKAKLKREQQQAEADLRIDDTKSTHTEQDTFNNNLESEKQGPSSPGSPRNLVIHTDSPNHLTETSNFSESDLGKRDVVPIMTPEPNLRRDYRAPIRTTQTAKTNSNSDKFTIELGKVDDVIRFEVEIESD